MNVFYKTSRHLFFPSSELNVLLNREDGAALHMYLANSWSASDFPGAVIVVAAPAAKVAVGLKGAMVGAVDAGRVDEGAVVLG